MRKAMYVRERRLVRLDLAGAPMQIYRTCRRGSTLYDYGHLFDRHISLRKLVDLRRKVTGSLSRPSLAKDRLDSRIRAVL